jgi:hypothetical protein
MSIRSLFTSHERLLAEWMMNHEFNREIQAKHRFPNRNQEEVKKSYYTLPKESQVRVPSREEKEAIYKRTLAHLGGKEIPEFEVPRAEDVPEQKPVYQYAHGGRVEHVEKKSSLQNVNYGDFWGRTYFTDTKKQTGYFLVDGWLVVSAAQKVEDKPYEVNSGDEITIVHKFDQELDAVPSKMVRYIQSWFHHQGTNLTFAAQASFAGSAVFSAITAKMYISDRAELPELVLVIGCIAMYALTAWICCKQYQLHYLKGKMDEIQNLGHWVAQMRVFKAIYPDLLVSPHAAKFFVSKDQRASNPIKV